MKTKGLIRSLIFVNHGDIDKSSSMYNKWIEIGDTKNNIISKD